MSTPRATYRLQLSRDLTFDQVAGLVDYFKALGVSHLYLSPILQAVPTSTHGYDVIDPSKIDSSRGGKEGFERLVKQVQAAGLGLVVDIVPNHLGVSPENRWWWEVLENGPLSRWAHVFDVDWTAFPGEETDARVLLPVLGDHYGRVLERGEIRVRREGGAFRFDYFEHHFPISPRTLDDLLSRAASRSRSNRLAFLAQTFSRLPEAVRVSRAAAARRHRDKEILRRLLAELLEASPKVKEAVDIEVSYLNADLDRLDQLHEAQNYRLSFWRLAGARLNYRRFFDINALVGVRMEQEDVFFESHAIILDLVHRGVIDGLRVDHPDGLRDPKGYFQRLASAAPSTWIVAEKILESKEHLRSDWPIAGTTGYDFLALVQGLFVDARAEYRLSETYRLFVLEDERKEGRYEDLVFGRKLAVCRELLPGDVTRLAQLLREICDARRRYRDFTRPELRELVETMAAVWPVYRTYVRSPALTPNLAGEVSEADAEVIEEALETAKKRTPHLETELFELFHRLMTLREPVVPGGEADDPPPEHEFVMRFQQLTGPVMAKGVEDTVYYRFNRLVALNEVGGAPSQFGVSPNELHTALGRRNRELGASMLSTSTHDTKRSEDVRARLLVLTEVPEMWAEAVERWARMNENRRRDGDVDIDRNTEYLFYQTLVGAWPARDNDRRASDWPDRVVAYMLKAAKEAKERTTWLRPQETYESALEHFVRASLEDEAFVEDVEDFVERIRPSGWHNALAQTLLKVTSPGSPDIYQGCELWDLSLVDPDNRRPVDFGRRQRLLQELESQAPAAIWARMDEGLPKLWILKQALGLRARRPELFASSDAPEGYRALELRGPLAEQGFGFVRNGALAVVVSRLTMTLSKEGWGDTVVELPEHDQEHWTNVLTGASFAGGSLPMAELLGPAPVALLYREPSLSEASEAVA